METILSPASCPAAFTASKEASTRQKSRQTLMLFFLRAWKETAVLRGRCTFCYRWASLVLVAGRLHVVIRYREQQTQSLQSAAQQSFWLPDHRQPDKSYAARRWANLCGHAPPNGRSRWY